MVDRLVGYVPINGQWEPKSVSEARLRELQRQRIACEQAEARARSDANAECQVEQERRQAEIRAWSEAVARLPPTPRALVGVMVGIWPPRGNPALLRENAIEKKIREHSDVTFERTSLRIALDFVRHGKLPPKRARTNTNNLRTNNQ
jgi:hypothetical protein